MAVQILVTGATGNVGSALVRTLLQRGVPVRAAASDTQRLKTCAQQGAETVVLDFCNPATFRAALDGCTGLFLLRPPALSRMRRTLLPFVDVARSLGVKQVVFLSVQGADKNRFIPHHAVERALQTGPGGWTLLRPGFFAQNLGDAYRRDIARDSRLYLPAGAGRVAFVDTRDIAEAAAICLLDPEPHQGQAYSLTGAQALSLQEVAQLLSEALGRPIRYEPASIPGYIQHLRRQGLSPGQIAVMTALHVGLRFGQGAPIDPTLPRLLGHPARSVQEYIRDHIALWRV
jgi:uncharacterized protein YbjT (DUF2867 family)